MTRAGTGIVLQLALAFLASQSLAGQAPLCDARFEVEGGPLLPGASAPDAVVVSAGRVSIGGCVATRARARATTEGTRARVRFSSYCPPGRLCSSGSFVGDVRDFYAGGAGHRISRCGEVKGVRLEVWIDPACQTLVGRVRARDPRLERTFTAAVAAPASPPDCIPTSTDGSCAE